MVLQNYHNLRMLRFICKMAVEAVAVYLIFEITFLNVRVVTFCDKIFLYYKHLAIWCILCGKFFTFLNLMLIIWLSFCPEITTLFNISVYIYMLEQIYEYVLVEIALLIENCFVHQISIVTGVIQHQVGVCMPSTHRCC